MADFEPALQAVLRAEGGYGLDPRDPGAETYRGISRRAHPGWSGWTVIDERKRQGGDWQESLEHELAVLVAQVYRVYWDAIRGAAIVDQPLAATLFDAAVNLGAGTATLLLQQGLNALNRNGHAWPDIAEDAGFGERTLAAVAACCAGREAALLVKTFNHLRGAKYVALMRKNPTLEAFARGWIART